MSLTKQSFKAINTINTKWLLNNLLKLYKKHSHLCHHLNRSFQMGKIHLEWLRWTSWLMKRLMSIKMNYFQFTEIIFLITLFHHLIHHQNINYLDKILLYISVIWILFLKLIKLGETHLKDHSLRVSIWNQKTATHTA